MRTGNPTLNKNTFRMFNESFHEYMTIEGAVNKTFLLLFLVILGAYLSWTNIASLGYYIGSIIVVGGIVGFIVAVITVFKKEWSPFTAPIYAFIEGFILGVVSIFFEMVFPGIVYQAVGLTIGTLFVLLLAYKSGYIKVTENFKLGIIAATGAIALVYFINIILGFFGISIPFIHESGLYGILFSVFVVVIAALNLVLDFDFIEQGAHHKAPKYMEWYSAFGLIVTLIWLYLEILRLLAKTRSRE